MAAVNSKRNIGITNQSMAKNLEKLSSGYKINRAGDDAAGLAISERMRGQITSMDQGKRNVQDGISLVQTVEGALTEVHSMLNRMKGMAVSFLPTEMEAVSRSWDETWLLGTGDEAF